MPPETDELALPPDGHPVIHSRFRRVSLKLIAIVCVLAVPLLWGWWIIPLQVGCLTASPPKPLKLNPDQLTLIDQMIEAHSGVKEWQIEENGQKIKQEGLLYRGDVDRDGVLDEISVVRGVEFYISGSGGVRKTSFVSYSGPTAVGLDDIDGDGYVDAWLVDQGDSCTRIIFGSWSGAYNRVQNIYTGYTTPDGGQWGRFSEGAFFDADGDGDLDHVSKDRDGGYWWTELEAKR